MLTLILPHLNFNKRNLWVELVKEKGTDPTAAVQAKQILGVNVEMTFESLDHDLIVNVMEWFLIKLCGLVVEGFKY